MNWFGLFKKKESVEPEKKPTCKGECHYHRKTKYFVDAECADKIRIPWAVDVCCNCETVRKLWKEYEW